MVDAPADNSVPAPRVSILIPNYNNGKASSRSGNRDFINDLLTSLETTLANDPTPFEVIACDDGSTDDSIDTLRDWAANRTWPGSGRPFLRLMEMQEHVGILSIVANRLYREARGEFLVRLDGDIVCLTPNWVTRLCEIFDNSPPRLGIVGPKQLTPDMQIHALGDWLLHPKGYHHIGLCQPRYQIRRSIEVDHVMGAFYCCRRSVWEDVGEFDQNMLRGQTVDFGMRARMNGWTCWAVPDIEFIHAHCERDDRTTSADSREGIAKSISYFEEKWGFSRVAPDLDDVRRHYAGTSLLWNARWFDRENMRDPLAVWARSYPEPVGELSAENTEWGQFANDEHAQKRALLRAQAVIDVIRQTGMPSSVVQIGSSSGLIGHLLARQGLPFLGLDIHEAHVEFAREITQAQSYPNGASPCFERINEARRLPLQDHSVDLIAIIDQMERHPNPVGLLKEVRRALVPGGFLVIVSERHMPSESNEMQEEHWYLPSELISQIQGIGGFEIASNIKQPHPNDIMLAARTKPAESKQSSQTRNEAFSTAETEPTAAHRAATSGSLVG